MTRAALVAAAAILSATSLAGSAPADDGRGTGPAVITLQQARAFDGFTLLYAGESLDGIPLTAVLRRSDTAELVSFVYGHCEAGDDGGCAPPVEVQVWPACRRNLGLYGSEPGVGPPAERVAVRGVPGALLDEGTRLELQTGDATVVVFADSHERVLRVASVLRPLTARSPGGALRPPVPGALDGRLAC